MYDKDEIRDNLTVEDIYDLLEEWGGEPQYTSFGLTARTICHNPAGEGHRKLYYYDNSKLFKCYTECDETFDIYTLVIKVMDIQEHKTFKFYDALAWIANYFHIASLTVIDNDITIEEFMKSTQIEDTANKAKEPEEQKQPMDQTHKPTHKIQSHNFNIAGLYHYENDIINCVIDTNYYYDLNKQELIDEVGEDERIYEYDFESDKVELKDEPNNEYDPKAIAIYVDGIKIGYVKKGSTSRVRNLLKKDVTSIWIRIAGGKYKILEYDYDEDKYNLYKENEPVSLFGKITIDVRETIE